MHLEKNKNNLNINGSIIKYYTYLNNLIIIQPRRRLGIWRKVLNKEGIIKKCFISLTGDPIFEPECFNTSKKELSLLEEYKISQKGFNSSIKNPLLLEPYVNLKGFDKSNLNYWFIPRSVQDKYLSRYNFIKLKNWQIDSLSNIFNFIDNNDMKEYDLNKLDKQINIESPYLMISSNNKDNIIISEIIALYGLLFFGKNILMIFTDSHKCESYYERSKFLFGEESLNLRIELFTKNTRRSINSWLPNIDITICTLEKGNSLINRLLSDNVLEDCIGTVIIDDINCINNSSKSYILEGIIAKFSSISFINSINKNNKYRQIDFVYISNNILSEIELFKKVLFTNNIIYNNEDRNNNNVDVYIKRNNLLYCWRKDQLDKHYDIIELFENEKNHFNNYQGIYDLKYLSELILESLLFEKKLMVFFPTIDWCKKSQYSLLQLINEKMTDIKSKGCVNNNSLIDKIKDFDIKNNSIEIRNTRMSIIENIKIYKSNVSNENDNLLFESIIKYGIAYHNGKLSFKEKKMIENSFKNNKLTALFCTSLNIIDTELKADRIIIRSIGMGKINQGLKNITGNREWISKESLKQYMNRIENSDLHSDNKENINNSVINIDNKIYEEFKKGIFIFVNDDLEFDYIDKLLNDNNFDFPIISQLNDLNLSKFILELVQNNIINNLSELEIIFENFTFKKNINCPLNNENKTRIELSLSLSFLIITQLLYLSHNFNHCNIDGLSLSNVYVQSIDQFDCFKSPIITSKFLLIDAKIREKFNKFISNIIFKQNDHLIKIQSGKKYLNSCLSNMKLFNQNNSINITSLGNALIYTQMNPCIALEIYSELLKIKFFGIDLSNELQIYILSFQAYFGNIPKINWNFYVKLFSELNSNELYIANLYGIDINLIKNISKIVNSNPNLIPDLTKLSPNNLHYSYFFSETLSYKGLIEKYRLIYIYKFYYSCLLRDISNPIITTDYIVNKYDIESKYIQQFINSFKISTIAVSNLCKQLGWLELSDIIKHAINHVEYCISIRNVKHMYKISQKQFLFDKNSNKGANPSYQLFNYESDIDQQDITKIINYINNIKDISQHITPNIAISFYFSGLTCIEKIANSKIEIIIDSINNAEKLDKFAQSSPRNNNNPIDVHVIAQDIIDEANKVFNQSKSLIDNDSYTELDPELELELGLNLELDQEDLDLSIDPSLLVDSI